MMRRTRKQETIIGFVCYFLLLESSFVKAFAPTPSAFSSSRLMTPSTSSCYGHAKTSATTTTSSSSTTTTVTAMPRLTPEEEKDLLDKAVQARKIKDLERQTGRKSSYSNQFGRLELAKLTGYGVEELQQILDDGQRARETLVIRNMGLVHYTVNEIIGKRKQKTQSLSREDLIQEGAIGLARAVDRWNPDIGGKFSTYAVYWVRAAILRCIAERDDMVRVPEHVLSTVRKVTRAAQSLGIDIDGDNLLSNVYNPSTSTKWKEAQAAKALAEAAGITDKQLMDVIQIRKRRATGIISFESWMQNGQDLETDLQPIDARSESTSSSSEHQDYMIETLSRFLRPREMEALSLRYGLTVNPPNTSKGTKSSRNYLAEAEEHLFPASHSTSTAGKIPAQGRWGEAMSFVEIGRKMKISAEYGRRLCHVALAKLRRAAEEGALEAAWFSQ